MKKFLILLIAVVAVCGFAFNVRAQTVSSTALINDMIQTALQLGYDQLNALMNGVVTSKAVYQTATGTQMVLQDTSGDNYNLSVPTSSLSSSLDYNTSADQTINALSQTLTFLSGIVQILNGTAENPIASVNADFPQQVYVTADALNIREQANTNSPAVGTLYANQRFTAVGAVTGQSVSGQSQWWYTADYKYVWSGGTDPTNPVSGGQTSPISFGGITPGGSSGGGSGGGTSTTTPPDSGGGAATSGSFTVISAPADPMKFQYLLTQKTGTDQGWYAFAEIETYDNAGKMRTPGSYKIYSQIPYNASGMEPNKTYDRNTYSIWNGGGGYPNTTKSYKAWISLDYGSSVKNSKIRILDNNFSKYDGYNHNVSLYGSDDGQNFWKITEFSKNTDPFWKSYWATELHYATKRWFEYPASYRSYANSPTASLTANGQKNITIAYGDEGIILKWNSTNADYAEITNTIPYAVSFQSNGAPNCISPMAQTSFPITIMGNRFNGHDTFKLDPCAAGKTITITYSVKQMSTGKAVSDSVTINVLNQKSSVGTSSGGGQYSISANGVNSKQGSGTVDGINPVTVMVYRNCLPNTGSPCTYETMPYLTTTTLTSGITAQVTQPQVSCPTSTNCGEYAEAKMTISVASSVPTGLYYVRLNGDNNKAKTWFDVPVMVYDNDTCVVGGVSQATAEPELPWTHVLPEGNSLQTTTWYDPGQLKPDTACGDTTNHLWQMQ